MTRLGARTTTDVLGDLTVTEPDRARLLLEMAAAALAAAEPEAATARALATVPEGPVFVAALGKAAPAMARGAASVLGGSLRSGLVVTGHPGPVPARCELVVGSHPVPDAASLAAGRRLRQAVSTVPAGTHVLFLISGGGSALAEVPASGLELADLARTGALLLAAGAPIDEMNVVRTHLSALKGGRLAAATEAPHTTVLVSDVPPGLPHLIASGPSLPCPTTPADALAILAAHDLMDAVPDAVARFLATAPPPPAVPADYTVAADGAHAARAAAEEGRRQGSPAEASATTLTGPAATTAPAKLRASSDGTLTVLAGETTVRVRGGGKGGRNQEAALAAALALEGGEGAFLTFGTDGIDGPTDAAGALVDGATAARIRSRGVSPEEALADNDAYPALDAAGALVRCGPTGTNVADLWVIDRR